MIATWCREMASHEFYYSFNVYLTKFACDGCQVMTLLKYSILFCFLYIVHDSFFFFVVSVIRVVGLACTLGNRIFVKQ